MQFEVKSSKMVEKTTRKGVKYNVNQVSLGTYLNIGSGDLKQKQWFGFLFNHSGAELKVGATVNIPLSDLIITTRQSETDPKQFHTWARLRVSESANAEVAAPAATATGANV